MTMRAIMDNEHDRATLTASSAQSPVENTQMAGRSYSWRGLTATNERITAMLENPTFISSVVVYGHNLSSVGTVQVEYLFEGEVVFDTGPVVAADIIPLGVWRAGIDPWGGSDLTSLPSIHYNVWTEPTLVDGYQITFDDPNSEAGYIQVGRIFSGLPYSPPKDMNVSWGVKLRWVFRGEKKRTESGSLRHIGGGVSRRLTFDFKHLDDEETGILTQELLRAGAGQEVYINIYPEEGGVKEAAHAFVAMLDDDFETTNEFHNNFSAPLAYLEV
ncbi:hypothetical protein [Vreelandella titanicae]|nr:hypothetical protein [Halomonas titanicae]|tara:strand:- start:73 stop:891 length:819 start_codon:yes stop_codon:yes gene_type:complete